MKRLLVYTGRTAFVLLLAVGALIITDLVLEVGAAAWRDTKSSMCTNALLSPEAQAFRGEALSTGDYLAKQEAWLAERWYCN